MIELNRSRNNVVLSRRAVLEDERKEMRQAILDRLNPGDVVEGQISNIVDFGAFVDLDGMDGLIHISELSWSHVNHPSEVLEIGQTVRSRCSTSTATASASRSASSRPRPIRGSRCSTATARATSSQGRVTKVVTFGAFVEILPGVEGLVHISELAQHHVENPREVVSQGDVVNAKIIEVDAERRRLSLSLKRIEDGDATQPLPDGARAAPPADRPLRGRLRRRAGRAEPTARGAGGRRRRRGRSASRSRRPRRGGGRAERRGRGLRRAGARAGSRRAGRAEPDPSRRPSAGDQPAEPPRPADDASPSPSPAASERARAKRCGRSRGAACRRCPPTRSSTG